MKFIFIIKMAKKATKAKARKKFSFRKTIKTYGYERIVLNDTFRSTTNVSAFVGLNSSSINISSWLNNNPQWQAQAKRYFSWKLVGIRIEFYPSNASSTFSSTGNEFVTLCAVLDNGDANDYLKSKNCMVLNRTNNNIKYISMKGSQSGWMDTANVDDVAGAIRTGISGPIASGQMDYTVRIIFYCMFKNPD